MKKTNRQTTVHMIQHRKLKNKQHGPHQKLGVISGAPEGLAADPAPHERLFWRNLIWNVYLLSYAIYALSQQFTDALLHTNIQTITFENDGTMIEVVTVWAFDFAIWLRTFRFEFSSKFGIFVILLFSMYLYLPSTKPCGYTAIFFFTYLKLTEWRFNR